MKTLILLRHAKSSHDDPNLEDLKRPLNERGQTDAILIGKYLKKQKIKADLILSSPATRARQTIGLVLESAGLKVVPKFDERIYEASGHSLSNLVREVDDEVNSIILVGHNPAFEDLLRLLTGQDRTLPTASLARIDFESNQWSKLRNQSGRLAWLVTPKILKHA